MKPVRTSAFMQCLPDTISLLEEEAAKIAAAVLALRSLQITGARWDLPIFTPLPQVTPAPFVRAAKTPRPVVAVTAASPTRLKPAPLRSTKPLPVGSILERVFRTVRSTGPQSASRIGELVGITRVAAGSALKTLRHRGLVTLEGQTLNAKWSIVARKPQVDSAPANDVEVVWSGTKERKGEAPTLAAARETRAR